MNDIRRSILWVVFGLSMVLIWDKWQIHNGHKPTFFPGSASVPAPATTPAPAVDATLPAAIAVPSGTATRALLRRRASLLLCSAAHTVRHSVAHTAVAH